jgi:hypothetical protein
MVPISHGRTVISEKKKMSLAFFTGLVSLLSEYPPYNTCKCHEVSRTFLISKFSEFKIM